MKLPVFSAFGASISYIAAHFLTLVRITWLPALLMMAATVYFVPPMIEAQMNLALAGAGGGAPDETAAFALMAQSMKTAGFIYLASAILYPMLIAGVLRHVIRGEAPRFLPFYLWFGADEFRVLISYIVLVVMFILAGLAGALGVMVLGIAAGLISQSAGGVAVAALAVVFIAAFLWFALRMSLIFPATVADRTIGVGRSWQVTKGAVWSLLFYWILWGIVFAFIAGVYAVFGASSLFAMLPEIFAAGGDEAAIAEIQQRMYEAQAGLYDMSKPGFWTYNVATYLYLIVSFSFSSVAGGVAYRYLAGEERG